MLTGRALWDRAVAIAVLAVLIAVAWVGPISLYLHTVAAGADHIERERQLLQRYQALARTQASDAELAGPSMTLPDIPTAQAIALLQESLKTAAAACRIEVLGLQVLNSDALSGADRIGVRLTASGDMAGLARYLFSIEMADPILSPDNLQIRSRGSMPGKTVGDLDFQLDVSRFKRGTPR